MTDVSLDEIKSLLSVAGVNGFSGKFTALGGGEVNITYILQCSSRNIILRIAKDPGQATLVNEAAALKMLDLSNLPKLIFFDKSKPFNGRLWILESFVTGQTVDHLSSQQYNSLGRLLALVHGSTIQDKRGVELWDCLLQSCRAFGNEAFILQHPDARLQRIIVAAKQYFREQQPLFDNVPVCLNHGDATPDNTLVERDTVSLIDWEFSKFNDPMAEFSSIYYEDIEYNKGKWRPHINSEERQALFSGYTDAGGKMSEDRLQVWMNLDKLGACLFLYWRIHQSRRDTDDSLMQQYQSDLSTIIASLENSLLRSEKH